MKSLFPLSLLPLLVAAAAPDLKSGKFGALLSENAVVQTSSTCEYDTPETHLSLVRGETVPCAFHTNRDKEPWVVLKLSRAAEVKAIEIVNRQDGSESRAANLVAWLSEDGKTWTEIWKADGKAEKSWVVTVGTDGCGRKASWIKLSTQQEKPEYFHLSRVNVYGQ